MGIILSLPMLADEYVDNYGLKYTYTPPGSGYIGEATLSDGKGLNASTFTITASFVENGVTYSVTSIADDAFANKVENSNDFNYNYTPVHVIIPEGITTIGKNAFRRCSNLRLLELPSSLASIGEDAFTDCNRIGHVSCGFESLKVSLLNRIPKNVPMILYVSESYLEAYKGIDNVKSKFTGGIYGGKFTLVDSDGMSYVCATGSGHEATLYLGKDESDITVPQSITVDATNYKVYNIGIEAFYKFSNLTNLIIENGVTSIHKTAFCECQKLKRLDIRSTSIIIASDAFRNCSNLLNVSCNLNIPTSANSLDALPSNDMMKLYIRDNTVWNSYKTDQTLINKFSGGIYNGGDLLEVYDENSGMTYIIANGSEDATLSIGKNEAMVTIPDKIVYNSANYYITTIAKEAFKGQKQIVELTIEGSHFKGIGANAFYECSNLRNVVFPSSLSKISDNAFWRCSGLVHVVCKNSAPTSISEKAFMISDNTWSSATLYVPTGTTSLYRAATGWKKFVNILEGDLIEVSREGLTYACLYNNGVGTATVTKVASSVTRVTIPESIEPDGKYYTVTSIAEKAFQNCTNLEKVVLPHTLTSIGDNAFGGCSKLIYVVNQMDNPISINENVFSNYQAILFVPAGAINSGYANATGWESFAKILEGDMGEGNKDNMSYVYATYSGVAILVKSETKDQDVTIPYSVEFNNAFYTVTDIGKSAFKGNSNLVYLTIENGYRGTIGASAFQNCSNLQKVVLPSTLTKIDDYAFAGSNKIKEIVSRVVANTYSPFTFSDNVFSETIYQTATVYVPIGNPAGSTMTVYKGKDGWKNFTNYLEGEKLKKLVDGMTYEYLTGPKTAILISSTTTEKNVTIPDSALIDGVKYGVIAIDQNAFKGNTSIEKLTISEKVKTIGACAFQNCTSLKKIELPSTLTDIGEKAFDGCKSITHVCSKISTLFEINNNVFSESTASTASLYVPEGTLDTYKSKNGWNNFTNNIYTGYFVDDLTTDYLSYDCFITGSGNTSAKIATLTKSKTSTADVVIPDSVLVEGLYYKVTNIRQSAFSGNSKLVNITIPEFVYTIGDNAFNNCNNIANIISKINNPSPINDNVFSISSATLYVPVGSRNLYSSQSGWKKFQTIYEGEMKRETPDDMTYVYATGDKTAILVSTTTTATDVIIPDSFAVAGVYYKVIAIDKSVFKGKTSIVNLTLPSALKQIGDDAFNGCKNISTITCKAIEPPVITENVFPAYTATLYVPEGSRSKYKGATGWKNFANVFEGEVTLEDGMTFVYVTDDKTATLTKTTSSENDVTIRGSFVKDGVTYKVTAIGNSVFKSNTSVANLIISENIKSIGAYAFQGCTNLKRVELPSTLISIGEKAFDGDNKLVHVCSKIKSPLDINENVFSNHAAALYVPDGTLSSYQAKSGWNLFENFYQGYFVNELFSDGMTFICLKNGEGETVTTNAILTKASVSSSYVSIPASLSVGDVSYKVTTIGKSAFNNSSKLVNLTLSENIKTIEENAFANCLNISVITSLIKVPFDINDNVFSAYTASLYVPISTRSKYQSAKGWKNFSTILEGERNETTTDDGMTYIYATGDKTATLVKATTVDKDFTVRGSFKIGEVTYTVTAIDKSVFKDKKTIVSLKIEENVKSIGVNAFQNCVNLEKVELPSTITEIGEYAFDNCTRLSHIVSRVKSPFPINENVFSIYQTAKLYVPTVTSADYKTTAGWENFKYILVGDMKEVTQDDMTYYCVQGQNIATLVKASTSAAEVTIPATVKDGEITYHVTDIGAYAFSGIGSLKKLTISEGVKSVGIGAFQNCSNLDKVVLPASLTSIGEFAFDKCNRLTLVRNDAQTPIGISENVFSVYTGKLNVPIGSGGQYRNADGWKLFSTILEGDMLEAEVDGMTYAYVTGPRTATLMKGVTEATDLTIPSTITIGGVEYTVTDIGESAFANVTSIVNLTISGGIKTIGANAFRNCSYLTKVELPSSLTSIGSGAFSKCDRLSHVVSFIMEPFQISDDVFTTMVYSNGTLYVPVKTSDLYKSALGWNNFQSVLEGEIYEVTVDGMTYVYVPNLKIAKLTKGVSGVKDVTIPSSIAVDGTDYQVTDIDRSAFYGINSLENLIVSEGVKTIGYTAFKNCYNLKTVSLPSSLISIGEYAFENCKKIASINCYGKKPIAITENVFSSSTMVLYVPVGAASLYQADNCWGKFNVMEATTIIIGKSGKASYCGDKSLDFSYSDEIKAYIATGFDETEGTIWLTRVKDVPAGVPVLIKGVAEKAYNVPVTTSQNSYYKNMFKGNTSGDAIKVNETEGGLVNYYLSGDGTFKSVKGYVNLGNNKCYLQLPGSFKPAEAGVAQTVVIKSSGKASFAAPVDLDFTNVKGLKAFTATGYDKSTKTIWLTRVMKVQKGEGVLLKGNANDYEIPSVAVQSSYMNMFVGNTSGAQIQVKETSADGSQTNFYLNSNGSFVSVNGFVNIGNNKCYLELPTSMVAVASTRGSEADYKFEEPEVIKLPISFRSIDNDGDSTTGINVQSSMFNAPSDDAYYTLQGQRVEKPGKGIYIKNGKKVIIK